jgi:hypothetical protein
MPLGDMVVAEDTQPGLVLAQRCAVAAHRPPRLGIRCCGRLHDHRAARFSPRALLARRRYAVLKKAALMKWPTLAQRREDQAFELGWRLQRGRAPEGTRRAQYRVAASCAWC